MDKGLKMGKLIINYGDILRFMGLPSDTYIEAKHTEDGIEMIVVASGENEHDFLVSIKDIGENGGYNANIRRTRVKLGEPRNMKYFIKRDEV